MKFTCFHPVYFQLLDYVHMITISQRNYISYLNLGFPTYAVIFYIVQL